MNVREHFWLLIIPSALKTCLILALSFPTNVNAQDLKLLGLSHVKGQCQVHLNNSNIGCSGSLLYSEFENGRHLVNFPADDLASVGFAGSDLEQTSSEKSVLWVDRLYLNKSPFNADGQCSFAITRRPVSTKAECTALMSDGRKLKAIFNSTGEWSSVMGDLRLPVQDKSLDCEKLLRMHGFASRAQFECNFSRYSNEILAQAKECNAVLSEDQVKESLMGGMKRFDEEVGALGKEAACTKVLETLPMVVAK